MNLLLFITIHQFCVGHLVRTCVAIVIKYILSPNRTNRCRSLDILGLLLRWPLILTVLITGVHSSVVVVIVVLEDLRVVPD